MKHHDPWALTALLLVANFLVIGLVILFAHNPSSPARYFGLSWRILFNQPYVSPSPLAPTPRAVITPKKSPSTSPVTSDRLVGVFDSSSPSSPTSIQELDVLAKLGCNIIYNYDVTDGSPAQLNAYFDHARALGIKIIVGLDGLYGPNDEKTALNFVREYGSNPAVWGFGIADEKPEGPNDSAHWLPIITTRYQKVKQISPKPVMAIAVGWNAPNNGERQAFLHSFTPAVDALAIDSYPVPYERIDTITGIMTDAPSERDRWFIAQAFSWSRYPDTARSLGYDVSAARTPTSAEMENMARQALKGGASSLLFYSYFDIQADPAQVAALSAVIHSLRNH